MTPGRFIGWSITAIIGSVAVAAVTIALLFVGAFIEWVARG